jgi:hypothetical protein
MVTGTTLSARLTFCASQRRYFSSSREKCPTTVLLSKQEVFEKAAVIRGELVQACPHHPGPGIQRSDPFSARIFLSSSTHLIEV